MIKPIQHLYSDDVFEKNVIGRLDLKKNLTPENLLDQEKQRSSLIPLGKVRTLVLRCFTHVVALHDGEGRVYHIRKRSFANWLQKQGIPKETIRNSLQDALNALLAKKALEEPTLEEKYQIDNVKAELLDQITLFPIELQNEILKKLDLTLLLEIGTMSPALKKVIDTLPLWQEAEKTLLRELVITPSKRMNVFFTFPIDLPDTPKEAKARVAALLKELLSMIDHPQNNIITIPEELTHDNEFMLKLIERYPLNFKHLPKHLLTDLAFVKACIPLVSSKNYAKALEKIKATTSPDLYIEFLKLTFYFQWRPVPRKELFNTLPLIPKSLLSDGNFMLKALRKSPSLFAVVSENLRADKHFAIQAISSAALSFKHLSEPLRSDPDVVGRFMSKNPVEYPHLKEEFLSRKDLALAFLATQQPSDIRLNQRHYPKVHAFCDEEEFKKAAVALNPSLFRALSSYGNNGRVFFELKKLVSSILFDPLKKEYIRYLSSIDVQDTLDLIALDLIYHCALFHDDLEFQKVKNFFVSLHDLDFKVFTSHPKALTRAIPKFRASPKRMLRYVQKNPFCLEHAADPLKDDLKIVTAAVKKDKRALQFASERLQKDPTLLALAGVIDAHH